MKSAIVTKNRTSKPTEAHIEECLKKAGLRLAAIGKVESSVGGYFWTVELDSNGMNIFEAVGRIRNSELDLKHINTMNGAFIVKFWEPFPTGRVAREN